MVRKGESIYSIIHYFCGSSFIIDILRFLLMPFPFCLQKFLQDFRAELLAMNPLHSFSEMPFFYLHFLKTIWSRDIKFLVKSFSLSAFQGLLPPSSGPVISDEKSTLIGLTGLFVFIQWGFFFLIDVKCIFYLCFSTVFDYKCI